LPPHRVVLESMRWISSAHSRAKARRRLFRLPICRNAQLTAFFKKISLIIRTGLDQWKNCMNASTGACLSYTANSAIISKPVRRTNSFYCHLSQRGNRDSQRLGRPDAKPGHTFDGLGICMQFSFRDDLL
jgi:hypothetical protein